MPLTDTGLDFVMSLSLRVQVVTETLLCLCHSKVAHLKLSVIPLSVVCHTWHCTMQF